MTTTVVESLDCVVKCWPSNKLKKKNSDYEMCVTRKLNIDDQILYVWILKSLRRLSDGIKIWERA